MSETKKIIEEVTNDPVKKKGHKKLFIALGIVGALIIGLVIFVICFYNAKLGLIQRDDKSSAEVVGSVDEEDSKVKQEASEMEQITSGLESKDVVLSDKEVQKNEDVFNVLLIGTDDRTAYFSDFARGDSCMLFSYNKKTGNVKLVSFERGMGVPILGGDYEGQYDWLTHTFCYGGAQLMLKEIRECFKVDVEKYVRVNLHSFVKGIDALGGVDIELTQAEADYLKTVKDGDSGEYGYTYGDIHAGLNHLTGYPALSYARCRAIDSDWQRIGRQRTVIQAAISKVKKMNIFEFNTLTDQILPLVMTNLTNDEITELLPVLLKANETAQQMTIPAKDTYGVMYGMGDRSMFAADFDLNAQILSDFIYETSSQQ